MNKNIKKKPALSKPGSKAHDLISFEITESFVKAVKISSRGVILAAGIQTLDGEPNWASHEWIMQLASAIKSAASNAGISRGILGYTIPCVVIVGGPQIIIQRFVWPLLPYQAMEINARQEISSYLPGNPDQFVIGVEALREHDNAEAALIDVAVSAIPKDMALAMSTAVKWAGFKAVRVDVKENARARLACHYSNKSDISKAFGILDLNSPKANITLFVNGVFYSRHYFADVITMQEGLAYETPSPPSFDAESIISEIMYVVDFMKYQERDAEFECILALDTKSLSDAIKKISEGMDIPVISTGSWLSDTVSRVMKANCGSYLDAYAASIPSALVSRKHMMNLKIVPIEKASKRKAVLQVSAYLIFMGLLFAVGFLIPGAWLNELRQQYHTLDEEEARVSAIDMAAPSASHINSLQQQAQALEVAIDGILMFYSEFSRPVAVMNMLQSAGFAGFTDVFVLGDSIIVNVSAIDFNHVAQLLEYFRSHEYFSDAYVNMFEEADTADNVSGTVSFTMSIRMRRGMGVR